MEQLCSQADRFRKQGRLKEEDIEDIINKINAGEHFKDCDNNCRTESLKDEHRRVAETVEERLLKCLGTTHNTKQPEIFRIMGENCNGFNNRIGGDMKIAKGTQH
jgi:hypothetical protein